MPKNLLGSDVKRKNGEVLTEDDVFNAGSFGDGSDGSYTSGNDLDRGIVYNFTDFVLNSGDFMTATSSGEQPVIIKVQGDVQISGTIDLRSRGLDGDSTWGERIGAGSNVGDNEFEQKHLGNGTQGSVLQNDTTERGGGIKYGKNFMASPSTGRIIPYSGTGGSAGGSGDRNDDEGGGGGGGGASLRNDGQRGQNGDNGSASNFGGSGGQGGKGGGSILIFCGGSLTFDGTIDVRGEDGNGGGNGSGDGPGGGGGGGGGAGVALIVAKESVSDTGTKLISGGVGGTGGIGGAGNDGGDGGNGGDGEYKLVNL